MANTFGTSKGSAGDTAHGVHTDVPGVTRGEIMAREKELFGGLRIGAAIFGWLAATGTAVVIASVLAAAGAALGAATNTTVTDATNTATNNAQQVGLVAGIALLTVLFLAYYCGGYVAGRMARFNGMRQGIAVWVCGIVVALALTIIAAIAGTTTNALASLQIPQLPIASDTATTGAWLLFLGMLAVTLLGAILGGLAGMHYHRKIDKAALGNLPH